MLSFNSQIANKLEGLKSSVLKGHRIANNVVTDEFLEKRFSAEKVYTENLRFEFSKDLEVLEQYYSIRGKMYRAMLNSKDPVHLEDEIDRRSDILVVRSGDACVGGARMTVSNKGEIDAMPMEKGEFRLDDVFTNIDLKEVVYGEVSRIALLPQFANGEVTKELYSNILNDRRISVGGEVCFFATYPLKARSVRQAMSKVGMKTIKVPIDRPEHFYVSDKITLDLYAIDMTEDHRFVDALKNPQNAKVPVVQEVPEFA